jgi:hypothetical protein
VIRIEAMAKLEFDVFATFEAQAHMLQPQPRAQHITIKLWSAM